MFNLKRLLGVSIRSCPFGHKASPPPLQLPPYPCVFESRLWSLKKNGIMNEVITESKDTPIPAIPSIADRLRTTFDSQKTKSIPFRLTQLRKLYWG